MAQDSALVISIDARNAKRTLTDLDKQLNSVTKSGDAASDSTSQYGNALKNLAIQMSAVLSVSKAISMADEYTQMAARIRNATSSASEYEMVQERILDTANGTFRALSEAQEVYLGLAGGMKSLGKSTEQTLDVADSLSYAFVANASRADQAQSAIEALNKAMAKGKIDADAWISIVSAADNIIADMAKTTGKTESEIRKLGATGEASLTDLLRTLEATRDANQALANNMENSLADGIQQLNNKLTVFFGKANEATSATGQMAAALGVIGDNLNIVFGGAAVAGVGLLTKYLAEQAIAVRASVAASLERTAAQQAQAASNVTLLMQEATRQKQLVALAATEVNLARVELNSALTREQRAAATMRLTQADIALALAEKQSATATATYTTAATAATTATTALARAKALAMGLVGGPAGLAIMVATAAASYLLMKGNSEEATKSLRENNEAVRDAVNAYNELDTVKKRQQLTVEKDRLKEVADSYDELTSKLNTNAYALSRNNDMTTAQAKQVNALIAEYKKTNDLDTFSSKINSLSFISQESKDKFNMLAGSVRDAGGEFQKQRKFVDEINNSLNNTKAAGDNAASGIRNAAAALTEINTQLAGDVFSAKLQNAFEKQGKSAQSAVRWTQVYNENLKQGFKGVTVEQKKMLDQLDAVDKQREARQKASQAAASSAKSAASASVKAEKDAAKESNRIAEEAARIRESITYEYADREKKIELDLQKELADIRKAGMGQAHEEAAHKRAYLEKQIYLSQLQYEINEFQLTEQQKLKYKTEINQLMIKADLNLTEENKKIRLQALNEEYKLESAKIELSKQERMFAAREIFMSETDAINERYRLERANILLLNDEKERAFMLEMNRLKQQDEMRKRLQDAQNAWGQTQAEMNGTSGYQNIFNTQNDRTQESQELFDAQMALATSAEEQQRIWQEHQDRMTAIEKAGNDARQQLNLSYAESAAGSFADMFKSIGGEQSKAFKIMFAAQKAFAIAQSTISIFNGIAQAAANPFPYNLAAMATVAASTASIVSNIQAVNAAGFKSGGYTGNGGVSDVAGVVHGKEFVVNAEGTRRNRAALEAMNSGGTIGGLNVTINNNANANVVATQNSDGSVTIDVVERKINESWQRAGSQANSNESRALQRGFGLQPAR